MILKQSITALVAVLAVLVSAYSSARCPAHSEGHLAVVIDDLGYNLERGQAAVSLPAPVTLAIIPETPYAEEIARLANTSGKETMIHMPMTSTSSAVTEPLVLEQELSREEFNARLARAQASVRGAKGMNNHMGSALTRDPEVMQQLMDALSHRDFYFIDSRTTPDTVAEAIAQKTGVPTASRSVFLDNVIETEAIAAQLSKAVATALENGTALAIGHPHDATLRVLSDALPQLPTSVTVVSASDIARCR